MEYKLWMVLCFVILIFVISPTKGETTFFDQNDFFIMFDYAEILKELQDIYVQSYGSESKSQETKLLAGSHKIVVNFSKTSIKTIIFDSNINFSNVYITVKESKENITGQLIPYSSEVVYKYLEIIKTLKDESISNPRIIFTVEKIWIDDNKLDKNTVSLNILGKEWISLPTKYLNENDDYIEFESEISGFSIFSITAKKNALASYPEPSIKIEILEKNFNDILFKFDIENLFLVDPIDVNPDAVNKEGEGHIAMFLDEKQPINIITKSYKFYNLSQGKHTLRADLHKNDHSHYNAYDSINFEVSIPKEEFDHPDFSILAIVFILIIYFYFIRKFSIFINLKHNV